VVVRGIHIAFPNEEGDYEQTVIYFYGQNFAGRGLDFDENPYHKEDFLTHAVQLTCIHRIK